MLEPPAEPSPTSSPPSSYPPGAMRLARVVYTRVETRLNPDYQVLGFSPSAAALVSSRALDGFFHGLLGQPDTLVGFERACLFAPIHAAANPAGTGTIWIAGLARASDKPDRHGRTGVLNFSVVLLTQAQAAALAYDPWPLFEPARSEEAFPFVDDPEVRLGDFEYAPAAALSSEGADTAASTQAGASSLEALLSEVRTGRCVLLRALCERSTAAELERAVREVHQALTPAQRASVPFLTYSFRPATSAARMKLLAAPRHAPMAEEEWRRLSDRYVPRASRAAPVEVWRQSTAAALQAAATLAQVSLPASEVADKERAVSPRAPRKNRLWKLLRARLGPRLVGAGVAAMALALLVVLALWVRAALLEEQPPRENSEQLLESNDEIPSEPSEEIVELETQNGSDTTREKGDEDLAELPAEVHEQLEQWQRRWRTSGLWPRGHERADAQETFADFAEPFRAWLAEVAPPEESRWPVELRRLASEVALLGWRLDGRDDNELAVSFLFRLELNLARGYTLHPIRMDYVPPGAILPSRRWRLTRELHGELSTDEVPRPRLAFGAGDAGGHVRVRALVHPPSDSSTKPSSTNATDPQALPTEDGTQETAPAPQPVEVEGRFEVPTLGEVLTGNAPRRVAVRDRDGFSALVLEIASVRIQPSEATQRAGFPRGALPLE